MVKYLWKYYRPAFIASIVLSLFALLLFGSCVLLCCLHASEQWEDEPEDEEATNSFEMRDSDMNATLARLYDQYQVNHKKEKDHSGVVASAGIPQAAAPPAELLNVQAPPPMYHMQMPMYVQGMDGIYAVAAYDPHMMAAMYQPAVAGADSRHHNPKASQ
jgi:hypothetical protein